MNGAIAKKNGQQEIDPRVIWYSSSLRYLLAAAECLDRQDKIGTLEAGKLGDIIVYSQEPLADIKAIGDPENIVLVVKDGQVMKNLLEVNRYVPVGADTTAAE